MRFTAFTHEFLMYQKSADEWDFWYKNNSTHRKANLTGLPWRFFSEELKPQDNILVQSFLLNIPLLTF